MKKNTLFLAFLFFIFFNYSFFAQVSLSKGDIVILQFNSDGGSDELVFLPLVDLPANAVIYFSDGGWNSTLSDFGNTATERGIKFTVNASGISAGTLIKLLNPTGILYTLEPNSLGALEFYELDGGVETGSSRELTLSTSGDQIIIFQTSDGAVTSAKTFIYGFNTRSINTTYTDGWQTDGVSLSSTSTDSHLPPGLTALNSTQSNKTTASAFGISGLSGSHFDNWQYIGPFSSGTRDEWLNRVHTLSNWSSNDDTVYSHTAIANGANSVTVSNTLGIDNFENEKIRIFPNPSSDYINISGITNAKNYIIYNVNGKEVIKGKITDDYKIDIKTLANNNLYFLLLEKGNAIKFIKK